MLCMFYWTVTSPVTVSHLSGHYPYVPFISYVIWSVHILRMTHLPTCLKLQFQLPVILYFGSIPVSPTTHWYSQLALVGLLQHCSPMTFPTTQFISYRSHSRSVSQSCCSVPSVCWWHTILWPLSCLKYIIWPVTSHPVSVTSLMLSHHCTCS